MNWKERLTELKVGDRVKVLKPGCNSPSISCCRNNGYFSKTGTIIGTIVNNQDPIKFDVAINENNHCYFPKNCLEKVI